MENYSALPQFMVKTHPTFRILNRSQNPTRDEQKKNTHTE